jgi:hydrogenase/urease accessory protein HupE
MILSARVGFGLALAILFSVPGLSAHPLSTFGVRLNVSGHIVTVTLNADAAPLIAKLDALSADRRSLGEGWLDPAAAKQLERVRLRGDVIRALSFLSADQAPVALTIDIVRRNADGQVEITLSGSLPSDARSLAWQSRLIYGAYPLSVSHGSNNVESVFWLQGSEASPAMPVRVSSQSVATFTGYAGLGFVHILPGGLDHILFVIGLFLLTPKLRSLLAQVTVFTLAHSVSLGLAMFGLVTVPPSIVEPLIALSIAYVGVENLFQRTLSSRRLWLVAAFGLLHGLGFAAVLSAISLPPAQWLPALLGFNVGVELGQLAVLALAAVTMFVWSRWLTDADQWVRRPASAAIALMGVFWVVTRL